MKTFAFFNVKGGASKTTSATTIAHMIATKYNKKVLIVDLDPQSNTSSLFCQQQPDILQLIQAVFVSNDISILNTFPYTVGNLLTDASMDVDKVIVKTEYEGLDLIPAFLTLAEIEEQMKADIRTPQQFRLKGHLEKVADRYDYCILDCSPSISIININGLAMTDYVFTPLRCDLWGIAGYCIAHNLMETVKSYNPKLQFGGCFFTQFNSQARISGQLQEIMSQVMGERYIDIPIRHSIKVAEMTYEHKPLLAYAPKIKPTEDYLKLTDYIVTHY